MKKWYVYITTNPGRSVLYVGFTNNLYRRIFEHYENRGNTSSFAGKYYCYNLVFYEFFTDPKPAIAREKEIKGWIREKKNQLIERENPNWIFLSDDPNQMP